jgi:hypothetical protein
MPYTAEGKALMLNGLTTFFLAYFTGDPTAGGVEVSGGNYARQEATYGPPVNGARPLLNEPVTFIPGGVSVPHSGVYSAETGGVLLFHKPLSATRTAPDEFTITITDGEFDLNNDPA